MNHNIKLNHQQLQMFIQGYFEAVANKDLNKLMSYYAEDASFTVHPAENGGDPSTWGKLITFKSKQEIHKLYEQFLQDVKKTIICRAEHVVIDEAQQRIATEQRYVAHTYSGELVSLYNCNFFDLNNQGLLCRIMNWSANEPYQGNN